MWVDKQRKEREIRGWRQLCTRTCWVEGWGGGVFYLKKCHAGKLDWGRCTDGSTLEALARVKGNKHQ